MKFWVLFLLTLSTYGLTVAAGPSGTGGHPVVSGRPASYPSGDGHSSRGRSASIHRLPTADYDLKPAEGSSAVVRRSSFPENFQVVDLTSSTGSPRNSLSEGFSDMKSSDHVSQQTSKRMHEKFLDFFSLKKIRERRNKEKVRNFSLEKSEGKTAPLASVALEASANGNLIAEENIFENEPTPKSFLYKFRSFLGLRNDKSQPVVAKKNVIPKPFYINDMEKRLSTKKSGSEDLGSGELDKPTETSQSSTQHTAEQTTAEQITAGLDNFVQAVDSEGKIHTMRINPVDKLNGLTSSTLDEHSMVDSINRSKVDEQQSDTPLTSSGTRFGKVKEAIKKAGNIAAKPFKALAEIPGKIREWRDRKKEVNEDKNSLKEDKNSPLEWDDTINLSTLISQSTMEGEPRDRSSVKAPSSTKPQIPEKSKEVIDAKKLAEEAPGKELESQKNILIDDVESEPIVEEKQPIVKEEHSVVSSDPSAKEHSDHAVPETSAVGTEKESVDGGRDEELPKVRSQRASPNRQNESTVVKQFEEGDDLNNFLTKKQNKLLKENSPNDMNSVD